jgi:ribosomal protein L12E/L44/L45/RPP1/RPP2
VAPGGAWHQKASKKDKEERRKEKRQKEERLEEEGEGLFS